MSRIAVAAAARLAGVPRSWIRRAIDRGELDAEDGRLRARDVPQIREMHAISVTLSGRTDIDWPDTESRLARADNALAVALDALIDDGGAMVVEALPELLEAGAVVFDALAAQGEDRAMVRAFQRDARELRRIAESITSSSRAPARRSSRRKP